MTQYRIVERNGLFRIQYLRKFLFWFSVWEFDDSVYPWGIESLDLIKQEKKKKEEIERVRSMKWIVVELGEDTTLGKVVFKGE